MSTFSTCLAALDRWRRCGFGGKGRKAAVKRFREALDEEIHRLTALRLALADWASNTVNACLNSHLVRTQEFPSDMLLRQSPMGTEESAYRYCKFPQPIAQRGWRRFAFPRLPAPNTEV